MNIIIIDDDRKAAETLKSKLTEYDEIEIIGMAHNGMDGLRLYNDSKPDLMFLDVDMPDISGIEFLERIEMNMGSRCRVVMYTVSTCSISGRMCAPLCPSRTRILFCRAVLCILRY